MVYDKAWNVAYRRDRDAGRRRYVDADPVRVRLQALAGAGVPLRTLARVSGLSATTLATILDGTQEHVQRGTAARVAQLSLSTVYASVSTGHVPRVGAARRVQALLALGWPHEQLGAAGITNSAQIIGAPGELITVDRWRQVRDVYDALSMTPGPSSSTRARAAKLGYAPPLAWDEDGIDDPNATPERDVAFLEREVDLVDEVAVDPGRRKTRPNDDPDPCRAACRRRDHGRGRRERCAHRRPPRRHRPHRPSLAHPRQDPRRAPAGPAPSAAPTTSTAAMVMPTGPPQRPDLPPSAGSVAPRVGTRCGRGEGPRSCALTSRRGLVGWLPGRRGGPRPRPV